MDDRDDSREEPGFLSRWSQRKLQREAEAELETEAPPPEQSPPPAAAPSDEAAPLPPLDALDERSDYSGFLSPGVGEELQRLALRKLFGSARFNIRDGLDDYDEDYRFFDSLGDTITADMRHRMQREADALVNGRAAPAPETALAQSAHTPAEESEAQAAPESAPDDPADRSG